LSDLYIFKAGLYSLHFIETLAMAGHMKLISPAEVNALIKTKTQGEIIRYLEGLIRASYKGA